MSSNTPNLGLLKKDPLVDGNETFNIETMLNENWDKIDEAVGRTGGYGVTTQPTANVYEVNLWPAPASLTAGMRATVKVNVASTGAPMLNINSLGAKPVLKTSGSSASFKQDGVYSLVYDGQAFILQGEGGEYGTAGAAQVLAPYTLGTENGVVTGTMQNKSGVGTQTTWANRDGGSWLQVSIPHPAYYDLASWLSINIANLSGANIKSGVELGGIRGTFTDDANLDPKYMLQGQVGYDKGVRKTGSMVNRPNNTVASAKSGSGGLYSVRPPEGYFNGSVWINASEPDLWPENIRKGKRVGDTLGTMGAIKKITRGEVSWGPDTTGVDIILQNVDFDSAVLYFTVTSQETDARRSCVLGSLTPFRNELSFYASMEPQVSNVTVTYQVVEYENVRQIQRSTVARTIGNSWTVVQPTYPITDKNRCLMLASYMLETSSSVANRQDASIKFDSYVNNGFYNFLIKANIVPANGSEMWYYQLVEFY